jgi:hypothetical protein
MSDDRKLTEFRRWILEVVALVAAPSEEQLRYARTSGVGVDEIVLQFDDAFRVSNARVRDGSMSKDEFELLEVVNDRVGDLSNAPGDLWTDEAVSTSSLWVELRISAEQAARGLSTLWGRP